jgi:hypothetical protein
MLKPDNEDPTYRQYESLKKKTKAKEEKKHSEP